MKTIKITILLVALISGISFVSCVEDGDFTVPKNLGKEENMALTKIIDSIKQGTLQLKTIKQVKELFISGENPV
ncbi:MAG: DUF5689 domain-containing protein, partial [Polaribacter sp.]